MVMSQRTSALVWHTRYHGTNGTIMVRTRVRTRVRTMVQALVRVQAHMLARIVMEIRAADIAVELEPQL
jgi:hypothetical protein